jgi:Gpi18-like mannosyltransferase/4-amino-4-deoxy-L-arabinose transferase-like glycosyltransferase
MIIDGLILSLGWVALAIWLLRRGEIPGLENALEGRNRLLVAALVLAALVGRLVPAALYLGHSSDVLTFSMWSQEIANVGLQNMYRPGYFVDYPPGYMYILWTTGKLAQWLSISPNTPAHLMLLKLPAILADIGMAFLVWWQCRKQPRLAVVAGLLMLFNPLAIFDSSIWGQVDSVMTVVLMASLMLVERRRPLPAAVLYVLAVLLKPQAMVAGPVVLVALWHNRQEWRKLLVAFTAAIAFGILIILPYAWGKEPLWIWNLYSNTFSNYPYLALNTYNLPALLGGNWVAINKELMGLEAGTWCWILFLPTLALIVYQLVRSKGPGRYVYSAAAIYLAFFVLAPKMHERYIYPAALLVFFSACISGDRRLGWLSVAITTTAFWNILHVLYAKEVIHHEWLPNGNLAMVLGGIANVILLVWLLVAGKRVFNSGKVLPMSPNASKDRPVQESLFAADPLVFVKPTRAVWIALAAIVVVSAGVSFWNLGSRRGPQTMWNADSPMVFDFGSPRRFEKLHYFHGLGTGSYAVSISLDGREWSNDLMLTNDNLFAELRWRSIEIHRVGQYLRVQRVRGGLEMLEFHVDPDPATPRAIPVAAGVVFDEPDTFVPVNTCTDGMYFDEVYHARSGWEMLRGMDATETSHPPLGKIVIAVGIKIFGMCPFGYRFFGALAGVLMLPVLFAMARRLTRRDDLALAATLLFSLDFMHFVQTRIATLDSFAVLLIMASFYCMLGYLQTPPLEENRRKAAAWLWGSGLCIGLGIATKWVCVYAGSGLAVLYFLDLSYRPRAWGVRSVILCIGAFVLLPLAIYMMAYIPYINIPGRTIKDIIGSQTLMYNYHANLNATHPYSSQWYEWPLITKPIWYFINVDWTKSTISSIQCFGSPVVWYLGSLVFMVLVGRYMVVSAGSIRDWMRPKPAAPVQPLSRRKQKRAKVAPPPPTVTWSWTPLRAWTFIVVGGLANYLPWVIVPRKLCYIYYFFPTVPFIILAMAVEAGLLSRWKPDARWVRALPWVVVVLALVAFVACYPVLSGAVVDRSWIEALKRVLNGMIYT